MRINTNVIAMNTQRHLGVNTNVTGKSVEKLSSGLRINRAADDAAGLAISEKMRSQIRGLNMASKNVQDGISLIQSAEGALGESHEMLQRIRELAVQAANGVNAEEDRLALDREVKQLVGELDRISKSTEFNTLQLLDGSYKTTTMDLQAGANQGQQIKFNIGDMRLTDGAEAFDTGAYQAKFDAVYDGTNAAAAHTAALSTALGSDAATTTALGALLDADLTTTATSTATIGIVDKAVSYVSAERSKMGAIQNRLEHTVKNDDTVAENLSAAESRIRDVDMAKEMMSFTRNSIMIQAATAMLAQANQIPQSVLQLIR